MPVGRCLKSSEGTDELSVPSFEEPGTLWGLLQRRVRGNCTGACGVTNHTRLIGEETTRSGSTLSHGVCVDRVAVRGRTGSRSKRESVAALGARRQNAVNQVGVGGCSIRATGTKCHQRPWKGRWWH